MVKASYGGGGRGMRLATSEKDFFECLRSAKKEALTAFGNDHVILEKFIQDPKHIEVQIIADKHGKSAFLIEGNVFDVFERDCSVQRRHQKILEEAPSGLDRRKASEIREKARVAAQAVGYWNAGTVEFLMDKITHDFYFMEMNTRLQVEHPVSEMVSGLAVFLIQSPRTP